MWIKISHGNDNRPLDSEEGEGLASAEDELRAGATLKGAWKPRTSFLLP